VIEYCRNCGWDELESVLDLGDQYLSDFRDDDAKPAKYPLHLLFCKQCALAQLSESAPPSEMYHENYSFKSGVNPAIKDDLESIVHDALAIHWNAKNWLDIASNDGTLLSFVPKHIYRIGIDPLRQFAPEAAQHANQIISDFFAPHYFATKFDIITSISMFYDLDDPNAFVAGVKKVLADDGIWIVQQNYLLTMIESNSFDNISHEHVTYFCLTTLVNLLHAHGLEVNDVTLGPVNGGVFRVVISHAQTRFVSPNVDKLLQREEEFFKSGKLQWFRTNTKKLLADLTYKVNFLREHGKTIYVYGASTRGGTIWQAANLEFDYVVDRNPEKVGKKMSAINAEIISEDDMRANPPDCLLVGPWWFKDQFVAREQEYLKNGGKMIFPIPKVEIVGYDD